MAENWEDPLPNPELVPYEINGRSIHVIRDDIVEIGSKARFGDLLIKNAKETTICYVQPAQGYAGMSLSYLCKRYNKKLVLFCPARKEITVHQAACANLGAELKFFRIPAMPILNQVAKKWSEENGALFVPLGLKHPLVTACAVKVADGISRRAGYEPRRCWCVISTGVLVRALGIAWPNCQFHAVAVARNIHAGEAGNAVLYSSQYDFAQPTKYPPPWPSVDTYDSKAYEFLYHLSHQNDWCWNVAGPLPPQQIPVIDSQREWNEHRY